MKNALQIKRLRVPKVIPSYTPFVGGLDIETPALHVPPGRLRASLNYECDIEGGYKRIVGYERFDGRTRPSDANYATMNVTITGSFAVGDTITGVTSGATAVVIAVVSTAPAYLAITKIVGTFVSGETLNVAGSPQGTTSSAATVDGASSPILHAQYKNLAADQYRNDITAIPGSGNTLGVVRFNGTTYGFRNNAAGTATDIYKSSANGWVNVPLGEEVSFTAGNSSVEEGDTLTQGVVTATIKRVVVTSGTSPNLAGRLIIYNRAGGNFAAGAASTTGGGALTLSGAQSAITIAAGGTYRFVVDNFGGAVNTRRIYGVNGASRGFEFDGSDYSFTPITTGMTPDVPTHVAVHKNHLFFAFGASVQHSAPGQPHVWSVIVGASELAMGDTVTGFSVQPGSSSVGALAIFTRNRTAILYGTGVSNWQLITYREELGAYAGSVQDVGYTIFLDDRGITDLRTAQEFGNFSHAVRSNLVKTWVNTQRTKTISSCIMRNKSQYRLFFSDGYALFMTFVGHKIIGMTQILFTDVVRNVWSSEESDGSETIFFGSDAGFIYEMEKGTSFDGDAIEHYLYLAWDFAKAPRVLKTYKSCALEVAGEGYAEWNFSYELGYATSDLEQPGQETKVSALSTLKWDAQGVVWDAQFWDGRNLVPERLTMEGDAENVSLMIYGSSDYHNPIRFSGAHIHYIQRHLIH